MQIHCSTLLLRLAGEETRFGSRLELALCRPAPSHSFLWRAAMCNATRDPLILMSYLSGTTWNNGNPFFGICDVVVLVIQWCPRHSLIESILDLFRLFLRLMRVAEVWRADGAAPFGSAYFRFPRSQPPWHPIQQPRLWVHGPLRRETEGTDQGATRKKLCVFSI